VAAHPPDPHRPTILAEPRSDVRAPHRLVHEDRSTSTAVAHRATEADAGVGSQYRPPPRRPGRRIVLGVLIGLLVAVFAGMAYVMWPRPATPITEEAAIERFRQDQPAEPGDLTGTGAAPVGVYVYAAEGEEDVSIGAVPLPTRDIPELVTVVVQAEGECWRITLNLMQEHTESSTYCADAEGNLVLVEQAKVQQVAGFTTEGVTSCSQGTLGRPGSPDRPVQCTLRMQVAGTTLVVELLGSARWEGPESLEVGGLTRVADRLVLDLAATGDLAGHWRETHWLDQERQVALRTERDILLDGPGRFEERTTLRLTDLEPRR
jgi:hypothetical protein